MTNRWVLAAAVSLWALGCRDEQAGPRPRAERAQGQQQPQGAGGSAQRPAGQGPRYVEGAPALTFKSGRTWAEGAVEYLGARVEPQSPQPGQQVRIGHYFVARKAAPQGWNFFVHVLDAASGRQVGNADHALQGGAAPLGSWEAGRIVEDVHVIEWPNFEGKLQFALGFWRDQERLHVDDAAASLGEERMAGPTVGGGAAQELPEYRIGHVAQGPTIDGNLDDAAWANAKVIELTQSFDGRPATRKTRARLVWDDANLYLGFECEDPDVWGSLKAKDDAIYNEEVVEAFFDANGDGKTYNELQVSPHNVQFDAAFVARRSDLPAAMKWESGMVSAVQVKGTLDDDSNRDQGWSAELKVPIANLMEVPHVPPQKGDVWRFNLYRLEHHVRRQQIEGQSFSPLLVGDFHHLPRFARLVFE